MNPPETVISIDPECILPELPGEIFFVRLLTGVVYLYQLLAQPAGPIMSPQPQSSQAETDLSRIPHDELESLQTSMRAYAGALLGHASEVEDLIQETNLYLLSNDSKFEPGTNFKAWALTAVYYRVLAWKRDRQRDRIDLFSEETLEVISRASEACADADPRAEALNDCLARLAPADREILEWKYVERRSLTDFAQRFGTNANNLHQKISRLRQALRVCIRNTLSGA